jgi:membrane-associated protease RseP (regulator of RpoE activity)
VKDPLEEVDVPATRTGLAFGLLVLLALVAAFLAPKAAATVAVVLSLIVMIILHEAGHYVMAKRAGMKVTEFFVGFGPRLWSFRRGETEYGIKPFVLGGYCRIVGMNNLEEVPPEDEDRTYRAKPFRQKFGVAVAGSTVHFMIAIILMFFVLSFAGNPNKARPITTLAGVSAGSPAAAAGLRAGDKIVAIDGKTVTTWDTLRASVQNSNAQTMSLTYERGGERHTVQATPRREASNHDRPMLGVAPRSALPEVSLPGAVVGSVRETATVGRLSIEGLGRIFSPSGVQNYTNQLSGKDSSNTPPNSGSNAPSSGSSANNNSNNDGSNVRFVSPIGIARYAGQAVQSGWVTVFLLLISINVFVGIFNLIPLLPFDGGLVAIAVYEKIASSVSGKKVEVDVRKLIPITAAVVAVLLFIGISAMYLDIVRPL